MKRWRLIGLVGCLLIMIAPWLTGGRDPVAMVIDVVVALVATGLLWTLPADRKRIGVVEAAGLGLVAWTGLSLIWSVNRYQTLITLVPLLLALVAAIVTRYLAGWRWPLRYLVAGYLAIASLVSAYGIWLYLTTQYERLTSSFYWPNPCAAYLLPALLGLGWRLRDRWRWPEAGLLILNGAAFVLTASRGAALVLILVVILMMVFSGGSWRQWIRIVFICLLAYGLSWGVSYVRVQRAHPTTLSIPRHLVATVQTESALNRQDRWNFMRSTIAIWWQAPVVGTGAGTYPTLHPQYQYTVQGASASAHNYYAQTLSELGLVGGVLLTVLTLGLLGRAGSNYRRGRPAAGIILAALAALALHFGLDIDASYPALLILAGGLVGLVLAPPRPVRELRRHHGWLVLALVVVLPYVASLDASDVAWARGQRAQLAGQVAGAATEFLRAHQGLAFNPDTWTAEGIAYYLLAAGGQDRGLNLALARDRALMALRLDPSDAQQPFLLARVERQLGRLSAAEQAYHQALALDPYNHPQYYADLADLYWQVKQWDDAELYVNQGLALYPDNVVTERSLDPAVPREVARLEWERARLLLGRGDRAGARVALLRARRLDPASPVVMALFATL